MVATTLRPAVFHNSNSGAQQGLTRQRAGRYAASVCGLATVLLFPQPWVRASLSGVGEVTLSGLELARADAARRVDAAMIVPVPGGSMAPRPGTGASAPILGAGAASGAGSITAGGGLVLPTRVPTVAAGTQGGAQVGGQVGTQPAVATAAQPAPAVSPTAVPATGRATGLPAEAVGETAPPSLPQFSLYLLFAAALGLAIFPLVWERQHTARDRRFAVLWTLVVSYGGALWTASMLRTVLAATVGNTLIGPGVGGTLGAEPALWAMCIAFLLGAASLTAAWTAHGAAPTPWTAH
jgi:hypothetical protein